MMSKAKPFLRSVLLAVLGLGLVAAPGGCGGDSSGGAAQPAKRAATRRGGNGRGRGKATQLGTYAQIDPSYRRAFTDANFQPDPTGDENRDPFRLYVVHQGTLGHGDKSSTAVEPTDVCKIKNSKAPNYSLHDLRLIGIVLRGTRSFAQFRDPSGYGWIVRRTDCLGKEKAVVEAIGVGTVTVEMVPEASPGSDSQPERHDIALYPEEALPTVDDGSGGSADVSQPQH